MKYKILLGLGSLATIVVPISTIIACGKDDKTTNMNKKTDQQIVDEAKEAFVNASSSKDKTALATSMDGKSVASTVTTTELGYTAPNLAEGVSATYAIKTAYNATFQKVVITVTIIKGNAKTTQDFEITAMTDAAAANLATANVTIQDLVSDDLGIEGDATQLPSTFISSPTIIASIVTAIKETIIDEDVKALILASNITLDANDDTGIVTVTIANYGENKVLTIVGFKQIAVDLIDEIAKLQNFSTIDIASDELQALLANETNDVKDRFINISDYASNDKLYARVLTDGVVIDKVVVQTPFDPATRTMAFTITLARVEREAINNTKKIIVTFSPTIQELARQAQATQNIVNDKTILLDLSLTAKVQTTNSLAKDATPSLDNINILLSTVIPAPLSTSTTRVFTVTSNNNANILIINVRISDTGSPNSEIITLTISGFISQADLDASQLSSAVKNKLIEILEVVNTRDANDAQKQFPNEAFDVTIGQTTFSVTATKGVVNNLDGSIAYTYRATNSNLATSPVEGRETISGFQTNLTPSQKKVSVQGELDQTTVPINSHSSNIAPKDYGVEAAKPLLDALVANTYGVKPTYTKGAMEDGQVTFAIVYTFGERVIATKDVVIDGLKSNATIQRENDNSDINEVAQMFENSSIHLVSTTSVAAVSLGTLFNQAKAQALGIIWPNDLKGTTITFSHKEIILDGILQVSIQIAKNSGKTVTKQLVIAITGINAFKLMTAKERVILRINNLKYPIKNDVNYDVLLFNKINDIKQVAINTINAISTLSQVASIANGEQVKVEAAIDAYKNSIFLNANIAKIYQYGNKIISGNSLSHFGLTMIEVKKLPEPLLKVVGARVKIIYQDYDFENNYIIATLTIIANNQTQTRDIRIKGFGGPKTVLNDPTQVGDREFEQLILPSSFKLLDTIKSIGESAFEDATLPKGFTIPNNVTSIGNGAFSGATLPKGFTISNDIIEIGIATFAYTTIFEGFRLSNNVASIGDYAFYEATLPSNFAIPSSVKTIGESAFEGATLPKGFIIPNSSDVNVGKDAFLDISFPRVFQLSSDAIYIGKSAFEGVKLPQNFRLPSSIIHIDQDAFYGATLPEGFTLPNSVTRISNGAFYGATLPKGFTIPDGATIEDDAFQNVKLPFWHTWFKNGQEVLAPVSGATIQGATHIGEGIFEGAKLPQNFRLPSSVTNIGRDAFKGAKLPQNFRLPSSVKTIGESAFKGATLPKGFTIPNGVIIGNDAFKNVKLPFWCRWFGSNNQPSMPVSGAIVKQIPNINVITSILNNEFYEAVLPSNFRLPSSVKTIGESAFKGATLPEGFTIPNSITLGARAFHDVKLSPLHGWFKDDREVQTPVPGATIQSVAHIPNKAFQWAKLSQNFRFPSGVTHIGNGAFYGATLPAGFTIPNGVTIGDGAFQNVKLPPLHGWFKDNRKVLTPVPGATIQGVTHIGRDAFKGATLPQNFRLPSSVTHIGSYAFEGATLPEGFTIPNGVIIGNDAFKNFKLPFWCRWFDGNNQPSTSVPGAIVKQIPNINAITSILNNEFKGATLPAGFKIPSTVKHIGSNAFVGVTFPEGFTIPNGVTIGRDAFIDAVLPSGFVMPNLWGDNLIELSYAHKPPFYAWFNKDGEQTYKPTPGATIKITTYIRTDAFVRTIFPWWLIIPNSIRRIETFAFKMVTFSTGFTLPNSIRRIKTLAFYFVTLPEGFTIPDSVTEIANGAFILSNTNLKWFSKKGEELDKPIAGASLRLPSSVIPFEKYRGATLSANFKFPDGVTYIGDHAFNKAIFPTNFQIPESVTHIGSYAFEGATLPEGFTLSNSVTHIGFMAFHGATLPEGFTIPSGISISDRAFSNVKLLPSHAWFKDGEEVKTLVPGAIVRRKS